MQNHSEIAEFLWKIADLITHRSLKKFAKNENNFPLCGQKKAIFWDGYSIFPIAYNPLAGWVTPNKNI